MLYRKGNGGGKAAGKRVIRLFGRPQSVIGKWQHQIDGAAALLLVLLSQRAPRRYFLSAQFHKPRQSDD
jgi:hypothetical protein